MNVNITIPDAIANDVIEGLCVAGNWNVDTGVPKAQFAKRQLISFLENAAVSGMARRANAQFRAALAANPIT